MDVKLMKDTSKPKQLTVADVWPDEKKDLIARPMSYSESVKQSRPQVKGSSKTMKLNVKDQGRSNMDAFEKFKIEQQRLRKSLADIREKYEKDRENLEVILSNGKKCIREKTRLLNQQFFTEKSIKCNCKRKSHEEKSCFENVSNNLVEKIFTLNSSILEISNRCSGMRRKNETLEEILALENASSNMGKKENTRKFRKHLEQDYEQLKNEHVLSKERLDKLKKLQEDYGQSKQEEFMKNRVKILTEQVESRINDMKRMDEEICKSEKCYNEKYRNLEKLCEQCKEIKKELSETILNRRQFNLCLKENFNYDQRLRDVLEERERVQYEYGAMMEEMTVIQNQFDIEEKKKEKFCMSIMARLNELHKIRADIENMNARINQMQSEIFVRNCYVHAKEIAIKELSDRCSEFENKILTSNDMESKLKKRGEELQCKLTDTLFEICFAISWHATEEDLHDAEFNGKLLGQKGKCEFKEPCEYVDLDNIEQESYN